MECACYILSSVAGPVLQYFSTFLINSTIFEFIFYFLYTIYPKHFSF